MVSFRLSMWNFHNWFQIRNISHVFSISSNEAAIRGVRLQSDLPNEKGFAIVSETQVQEYRSVLSYGENRIYFHTLSIFEAMDEINYLFAIHFHWLQALKRINLSHGSLSELLALCNELMPYPILIFSGDQLLASSPYYQSETNELWQTFYKLSLETLVKQLPLTSSHHQIYESPEPVLTNSPLFQGRQILLYSLPHTPHVRMIAMANTQPFSPGHIHLMRELGQAVLCNLELQDSMRNHRTFSPEAFFRSCLQDEICHVNSLCPILRQLNWKSASSYTIFCFELRTGADSIVLDKLYQKLKASFSSSCCFQNENAIWMIYPIWSDSAVIGQEQLQSLLDPAYFVAGQSNISSDFPMLPQLMKQARQTMEKARRKNVFFLSSQEIISDYIYQTLYSNLSIQSFVHPAVRYLMQLDNEKNASFRYIETLQAYLQFGGNYNAAAKHLDIHRNTLVHRLNRIQSLTGISLQDPQEREALLLSILIANPDPLNETG